MVAADWRWKAARQLRRGDRARDGRRTLDRALRRSIRTAWQTAIDRKRYFRELFRLQRELVRLQDRVVHEKPKVVVIFEGRDAAGKVRADRDSAALEWRNAGLTKLTSPYWMRSAVYFEGAEKNKKKVTRRSRSARDARFRMTGTVERPVALPLPTGGQCGGRLVLLRALFRVNERTASPVTGSI